jgi:hypothetical protein
MRCLPRARHVRRSGIVHVPLCHAMATSTAQYEGAQAIPHPQNDPPAAARRLIDDGFVHLKSRWPDWEEARHDALMVLHETAGVDSLGCGLPAMRRVGEYVVPPPRALRREFQTLHVDFGVPKGSAERIDVARFTVLHIDASQPGSNAVTRIVHLAALLGQRRWPARTLIAESLRGGADLDEPAEGILGRIVEAADEGSTLPPKSTPGFLCGMEFSSYDEEESYFRSHGMDLTSAEHRIVLRPGDLLLIDNLRTAHGRLGRRRANELHQLFVGYPSLGYEGQKVLLERILAAFGGL